MVSEKLVASAPNARPKSSARILGVSLLTALSACSGNIDAPFGTSSVLGEEAPQYPGATASTDNTPLGSPAAQALSCSTPSVGPSPMRRLTHAEYDNAVRDLLRDDSHPGKQFVTDTQLDVFDNAVEAQTVPALLAEQYLDAAAKLAQEVSDVKGLLGCDAQADASCAHKFIARFGRRAYRRPLSTEELTRLVAQYDATRAQSDSDTGVRVVIASLLSSPHFVFRPEFGQGDQVLPSARRTSSFELASRLASLLWASIPDDALLDAAEQGRLTTREDVEREAQRMLADNKAKSAVSAFYEQWLGLTRLATTTKSATVYPEFNEALRKAMNEETRRFVASVFWEGDARLSTLLTAPYTFLNSSLAKVYGVTPPAGTAFERVELDPSQRAGVLTQASIMSAFAGQDQSSPIKRGDWVRTRLLCQDLPPPPASTPELPPQAAGTSNRERFAAHTASPACSGCHKMIDGLGFGLEHYDGIGRYRTDDLGALVDADGEITSTRDIDGAYSGGPALAARLASSEQVRDCLPTQWFRFALGRREGEDDQCSVESLRDKFAESDGDMRKLLLALTQTDAFFHYRPAK